MAKVGQEKRPTQRVNIHDEDGHEVELDLANKGDGTLIEVSRRRLSADDELIALVSTAVDDFVRNDVVANATADPQIVAIQVGTRSVEVNGETQEIPITRSVPVPPPTIHTSVDVQPNAAARLANTLLSRLRAHGFAPQGDVK